jgi:hypothetical protein
MKEKKASARCRMERSRAAAQRFMTTGAVAAQDFSSSAGQSAAWSMAARRVVEPLITVGSRRGRPAGIH